MKERKKQAAGFDGAAKRFLKRRFLLVSALAAAFLSMLFVKPSPRQLSEAVDFRVLGLLFALMVVIRGFRDAYVIDAAAVALLRRCRRLLPLYGALTALVFLFSTVLTNDVALLTFVPLTLTACRRLKIDPMRIVIIETLAANLGSSLTPPGNPQNLFLYAFYRLHPLEFFQTMFPPAVFSAALLAAAAALAAGRDSQKGISGDFLPPAPPLRLKEAMVSAASLCAVLAAVFGLIDWPWAVLTSVAGAAACGGGALKKVDYSLLAVFAAFFVFTKNLSLLPFVSAGLPGLFSSPEEVYLGAAALSQFISNVPAALLLAPFTDLWRPVALGVNIGGLGTLIASLASVISYQLYTGESNGGALRYLAYFTLYNAAFLLILIPVGFLLL